MIENLWVYIALLGLTVLNIIVPIPGGATVVPLLAILTDPHTALGLASFFYFLSGIVRVYLFRKDIQWHEIKGLWLPSVAMAVIGALALVAIPSNVLLIILFVFTLYFLIKKVRPGKKKQSKFTNRVVGMLSGFLQGTGIAGSDLRNSYLYAQGLTLQQVHGTTAFVGGSNFLAATIVRLFSRQVSIPGLTPILYLFPFIIASIYLGRYLLNKIPKKVSEVIIYITMVSIIVLLGLKIISTL